MTGRLRPRCGRVLNLKITSAGRHLHLLCSLPAGKHTWHRDEITEYEFTLSGDWRKWWP